MSLMGNLRLNKKEIIESYLNKTKITIIAKQFNCSDHLIRVLLREENVELKKPVLTEENLKRIEELHQTGMTSYKISQTLGIAGTTVDRAIKKLGYNVSSRKKQREVSLVSCKNDIIEKYESGVSTWELGKQYGCQDSSINRLLHKNDVEMRPIRKIFIDESIFEKFDTEFKAYFLGLIWADGSLDENRYTISLCLTDKILIYRIAKILKIDKAYIKYVDARLIQDKYLCKPQYGISLSSQKLYGDFIKSGVVPNKTHNACVLTKDIVSDNLLYAFFKGYFDGDGTIFQVKNSNRFVVAIIDNYLSCIWMKNKIKELLDIDGNLCKVTKSDTHDTYRFGIYKQPDIKKFLDWIYQDGKIYLPRKHKRYKQFLKSYNSRCILP